MQTRKTIAYSPKHSNQYIHYHLANEVGPDSSFLIAAPLLYHRNLLALASLIFLASGHASSIA